MNNILEEMRKYEEELSKYHIPRYNDLPDIELYMDQVLALINKQLYIITNNDNIITPSMVNNYVKFGLIPAPVGKRYTRKHLCYMIVLCFLKQILSMNEIKVLVQHQLKYFNELDAYNLFCNELEIAFKNCSNLSFLQSENNDNKSQCLIYCAKAIAYKLHTQKNIQIMAHFDNTTAQKADKKSNDTKKKDDKKDKQDKVVNSKK